MDFSFPKRFRLLKREEFQRVYSKGKKIYTEFFSIHYLENGLCHPRLGITVTKKVGKAHIRNRWKRLIKEAFRLNKHRFGCWDIVVTVKRGKSPPRLREVERDLVGGLAEKA